MQFIRFLKILSVLTIMALTYTHLQMEIFDLAYQGKVKENQIHQLIEENGNITYKILTLKSSYNLGDRLLAEDSNMQFADPNDVVRISTSNDFFKETAKSTKSTRQQKTNPLMSFLAKGFK